MGCVRKSLAAAAPILIIAVLSLSLIGNVPRALAQSGTNVSGSSVGTQQKPVPLWTYSIGNYADVYHSTHWTTPTIVNGVVYTTVTGEIEGYQIFSWQRLYAFDANSGKPLWYCNITDPYVLSCAVADGIVFAVSDGDNTLGAFKASNGQGLWNFTVGVTAASLTENGYGIGTCPVVADGRVYVSGGGNLFCLNAATGDKLWTYTVASGYSVRSTPVVNGVVYVGSYNNDLYALNASTGSEIWSFATGGPVYSSPLVSEGIVYFGSSDGSLYALNATDGTEIWSYSTGLVASTPAFGNGVVFAFSGSNAEVAQVYALNATDGSKLWNSTIGGYGYFTQTSSPLVVSGVVYVGSIDYRLYAINATNGFTIWTYATQGQQSSPVIADGHLYFGGGGTFYALTSPSDSTPFIPELSWAVIVPLLLSVIAVAVIVRHRKIVKKSSSP